MTKLTLTINDQKIEVPAGSTILEAIHSIGLEIPVFCYHPRLKIAGNCRMCLVDVAKSPKPVASCATPVVEGMVVHTQSPMVKNARQGALEFLLLNHPLDCPICDQGGECDLQDLTLHYGSDHSRFQEEKRAVEDKPMGPLIKTAMTRCIHCTRCIRFATDVAGVPELGAFGRGEHMEVSTYVQGAITSELSGNMIDLCPVGALTSKPYAFMARPWELTHTESIDVMDALGSHIRVDTRGPQVMRILPRTCEAINAEWISDVTRFACDGLRYQRLDQPYIRRQKKLVPCTWGTALKEVAGRLRESSPNRMGALAGDLVDAESLFAFKKIWDALGSPHLDGRADGTCLRASPRVSYLFNTTLAGIDQADFCLLIGTNPRWEAPLLNARLRKRMCQGDFSMAVLGPPYDLTYPYIHLGDHPSVLLDMLQETHPLTMQARQARNPIVILGQQPLCRPDGSALLHAARQWIELVGGIRPDWNGFNVLHTAAARVGALDIGWVPSSRGFDRRAMHKAASQGQLDLLYLMGVDVLDWSAFQNTFIVYQGHHGDAGAQHADVILPGAAYTEKTALYVNTEGRVQQAHAATSPPGQAREDFAILCDMAQRLHMPYAETLKALRQQMFEEHSSFASFLSSSAVLPSESWVPFGTPGTLEDKPLKPYRDHFYMTNIIAQHSPTMAQCVRDIGALLPSGGILS